MYYKLTEADKTFTFVGDVCIFRDVVIELSIKTHKFSAEKESITTDNTFCRSNTLIV